MKSVSAAATQTPKSIEGHDGLLAAGAAAREVDRVAEQDEDDDEHVRARLRVHALVAVRGSRSTSRTRPPPPSRRAGEHLAGLQVRVDLGGLDGGRAGDHPHVEASCTCCTHSLVPGYPAEMFTNSAVLEKLSASAMSGSFDTGVPL